MRENCELRALTIHKYVFTLQLSVEPGYFSKMFSRKLVKEVGLGCPLRNFHSSARKCLHFVQFAATGAPSTVNLGVLSSDLQSVISLSGVNPNIPNTLVQYLQKGSQLSHEVQK